MKFIGHPSTHGHHVNPYLCGSGQHRYCDGFSGDYDTYVTSPGYAKRQPALHDTGLLLTTTYEDPFGVGSSRLDLVDRDLAERPHTP